MLTLLQKEAAEKANEEDEEGAEDAGSKLGAA
jgi:hypothetical protein